MHGSSNSQLSTGEPGKASFRREHLNRNLIEKVMQEKSILEKRKSQCKGLMEKLCQVHSKHKEHDAAQAGKDVSIDRIGRHMAWEAALRRLRWETRGRFGENKWYNLT